MHAGQGSARARREKIRKAQNARLRAYVDDLIWDQYVKQGSPVPSWVRPMVLIGGAMISIAWIGAVAHGCGG